MRQIHRTHFINIRAHNYENNNQTQRLLPSNHLHMNKKKKNFVSSIYKVVSKPSVAYVPEKPGNSRKIVTIHYILVGIMVVSLQWTVCTRTPLRWVRRLFININNAAWQRLLVSCYILHCSHGNRTSIWISKLSSFWQQSNRKWLPKSWSHPKNWYHQQFFMKKKWYPVILSNSRTIPCLSLTRTNNWLNWSNISMKAVTNISPATINYL